MKTYLKVLIGLALVISLASFVQPKVATRNDYDATYLTDLQSNQSEQCGTDEIIRRNPFLMQMYANRVACAPEVDLDTAQVLTIPVVIHVVHLGEAVGQGTNISDEQVYSIVENLNHRFRGDTESLSNLTSDYDGYELSLVIDSKIEFCLAQRDPNNNPTNGIHRYNGSNLTWTNTYNSPPTTESYYQDGVALSQFSDGIDETYMKETVGCWDTQEYFNIWIVSEINGNNGLSGVQGFSYLGPTGTNCKYGPVCLYNVSGTTGNLKSSHNLNSTVTHEVGHAFSLYHTFWSQGPNSCSETNGCTQGDRCPDTPPTTTNYGCVPTTCPEAMTENYMDYSPQSCTVAFTQNQIERMRDLIWNYLPGLVINNVKCQPLNSDDLAITSVSLPDTWCLDEINFGISISNYGGSSAINSSIKVNGITYPLPLIQAGGFFNLNLTNVDLGDGHFNIELIYAEDDYIGNNFYSTYVEPEQSSFVEVIMSPDPWSNEISWQITNSDGDVVLEDGNHPAFLQDSTFYKATCLPEGCYTFTINDIAGDGMCLLDYGNDGVCDVYYDAFLNIVSDGELIFDISQPEDINFGFELIFDFCVVTCNESQCPYDLTGDCIVNIDDVLYLTNSIGCLSEDCLKADFDNDGIVTVDDLLIILTYVGENCLTGLTENIELPTSINDLLMNDSFEVIDTMVFDLSGKRINRDMETLPIGQYIVVQVGRNGEIRSKKIFILR